MERLFFNTIELSTAIHQAVELSLPFITESGHTLHLELPEKPITINADLVRLGQVFGNLLNNAAKFTPRGGDITVKAEERNGTTEVRVLDNGIGIPASMLDRIFDVFTQVDQSLEKHYGGLGIGLSLVKKLVTLHGGTVEAQSEGDGKGSEFIVRLPCRPPNSKTPDCQSDENLTSKVFVPRRILICDDNASLTKILEMHLQAIGHQVATASNGLEAVKLAEAFQPELILLDIGMPNLNGYDACRQIRQRPWGQDILIAAVTGWSAESDRQKGEEVGFDQYLAKPVDTSKLDRLIEKLSEKPVE
ncbi:hybrid sensor histidine kinase/response regulator [Methyloterricola oryzae]|uniref:hybrid sensor histidine kinase/response regulator n=1 Tax=Methyloterricola oryzae TaxID=1495050 RepID=UPI000699C665|nr:ATP-binding protein [Methyloterricola oryzae]